MGLETATTIDQLIVTNPANGDPIQQGDDHIRMLKQVLKTCFPLVNGPLNATMVVVTPVGSIEATTVQAALAELATEKASASHTHTASEVANSTEVGRNVLTAADASAARSVLGLVIGTDVQAADANIVKKNVSNTFTAQQIPMNGTLTDGATISWNCDSTGQVAAVTLGGNRTMGAPTNVKQYAMYILRVQQDATGNRTLSWNAAFKFGASGAPPLTTGANKVDIFSFLGGAGNTLEYLGSKRDAV